MRKKGKALYVVDNPLIMFTGKLRPFNPYVISGSFSTQVVIDKCPPKIFQSPLLKIELLRLLS